MLEDWGDRLRVVLTVRSDFEAQFLDGPLSALWGDGRFHVPSMGRQGLKQAIIEPAAAASIYFEPPELVDQILDEVHQSPGALPLLSFALSELYLRFLGEVRAGRRSDRVITQEDYEAIGGVSASLSRRADTECERLIAEDDRYQTTLPHVLLRMVEPNGERRRASQWGRICGAGP